MIAEYSVQLLIPTDSGDLLLKAERCRYLLMDLEVFADNLERHCNEVSQHPEPPIECDLEARERRMNGLPPEYWSKYVPFLGYGLRFTAKFGPGYDESEPDEVSRIQFEIDFKVNVASFYTGGFDKPVFVGAIGDIYVTQAREFASSLRSILIEDF